MAFAVFSTTSPETWAIISISIAVVRRTFGGALLQFPGRTRFLRDSARNPPIRFSERGERHSRNYRDHQNQKSQRAVRHTVGHVVQSGSLPQRFGARAAAAV